MRNKKKTILIALIGVFVLLGLIFCLARPSYVAEAVDILFKNELKEENIVVEDASEPEESEDSQRSAPDHSSETMSQPQESGQSVQESSSQESSSSKTEVPSQKVMPVQTLPESSSNQN